MLKTPDGKGGQRKFPLPAFNLSTWRFLLGALAFWGLFVTLKAWELNEKNAENEAKIQSLQGEVGRQGETEDATRDTPSANRPTTVAGSPAVKSELH